ncbi:hypothetical protein A2U01_0047745, partial [Trifolium medium]|nr:hypothetical protein [Trifolium medium]
MRSPTAITTELIIGDDFKELVAFLTNHWVEGDGREETL